MALVNGPEHSSRHFNFVNRRAPFFRTLAYRNLALHFYRCLPLWYR
jgi:hypothetical protein